MTKKDYFVIAEALGAAFKRSGTLEEIDKIILLDCFDGALRRDNEKFDYKKFSDAVYSAAKQ